ncbi:MAG: immunity 63 family protein [Oscillospiraceae bacterium]|jgi:hypothetical protein|nr:immunity 63 family protein [Oscillospiraceae bacterium]
MKGTGTMALLSTRKLKKHITALYQRVESLATADGVFVPLDKIIYFGEPFVKRDVTYCYSWGYYHAKYFEFRAGVAECNDPFCTDDLFEISYYILDCMISEMAFKFERKHRVSEANYRKIAFEKMIEYMFTIGDSYGKRCEMDIQKILEENPIRLAPTAIRLSDFRTE